MGEQDAELFYRIQNKEEDALEQLYDRYEKLLFSFAYRMTNNKFLAEEAVQDVFTKIWSRQQSFDKEKGKFSSWLLTVTRNACIDLLRKKKDPAYELEERDSLQAQEPTPEETVEWQECGEQVRKAIKQLTKEQQKMIELFYFKSMSQASISKTFNIPLGTVKGRVRLALKHLKEILASKNERGVQDDG
ncbi:sigma-70 family RNA polymerase sigma factor [Barrientosiimonas marina]|uniref:RNA polymerase sigma factor n=1 Tax=Lentibacillus kimchii TaxID=1542911 RepID=A0ABW2UWI3_9BACI